VKSAEKSMTIETVVRRMGVKGTYQGMKCLICGVELAAENRDLLMAVTKELYPEIARHVGGTGKTVERNLRTVTKVCWERGNREFLNEIAGIRLLVPPTSGEMIDYLVHYINCQRMAAEEESE
jgi:two-component system response regulator (stage 0 sporulation protein A)